VHGVMNTDNMSILGLTIDYGPYGWLEGYDKSWTPNTTDRQHKRYKYGNQPSIALWNLYQLANSLVFLTEDPKPFEEALERYKQNIAIKYVDMMRSKLGLINKEENDVGLTSQLESILELSETDMTIFFRKLSDINKSDDSKKCIEIIHDAFYKPEEIKDDVLKQWEEWFSSYIIRLNREKHTDRERKEFMNHINPKYVLRNYMAQMAIDKADTGDYELIHELYSLLQSPYAEQAEHSKWFAKRPEWARHKVGCSMLSCSS